MNRPLYFDYSATTPLDPHALDAMMPYLTENFGNSVSQLHSYGWEANKAVEKARRQVAETLACLPQEIFFTSGATESNNWALVGLVQKWQRENPQKEFHILSTKIEHTSVLSTLEHLQTYPYVQVEYVPTNKEGLVSVADIRDRLRPSTRLMSFMWVNNELGSINPMAEISALARSRQIYLHTDATQAVGKIPVNLSKVEVDLLSLSSHKLYGPKGVGALFIRSHQPKVQLDPLFWGGGQERGLRSGTVNVPGVVGFGAAMNLVSEHITHDWQRAWKIREQCLLQWQVAGLDYTLNGPSIETAPQIINLTLNNAPLGPLQLPGVAFSRGSACHSDSLDMSHVLQEIGLNPTQAEHTLRLSFGRMTGTDEFVKLTHLLFGKFKINSEINIL